MATDRRIEESWIVIPAYNESKKILEVIEELNSYFSNRIVVVNDCSSDHTKDILEKSNCFLINHFINMGQGAALQTGIDFALQNGAKYVVTFDADGQHRIQDAISMINRLSNDEPMMICGSRFLGEKAVNMPKRKYIALKLAVMLTRVITKVKVTDAHNGLRAINQKALKLIRIRQSRMAHATELISQAKKFNINYVEVPVQILYTEYSIAKGQKLINSVNILLDLFLGGILK